MAAMNSRLCIAIVALLFLCLEAQAKDGQWVSIFNGKNLDGWTAKIKGHPTGKNFKDTFRVKGGLMQVGYEGYGKFDERFGHIFYKEKLSHYRLRVE